MEFDFYELIRLAVPIAMIFIAFRAKQIFNIVQHTDDSKPNVKRLSESMDELLQTLEDQAGKARSAEEEARHLKRELRASAYVISNKTLITPKIEEKKRVSSNCRNCGGNSRQVPCEYCGT